jgi:hypothetical protein
MTFDSVILLLALSAPEHRDVLNCGVLPVMSEFAVHPGWVAAAE